MAKYGLTYAVALNYVSNMHISYRSLDNCLCSKYHLKSDGVQWVEVMSTGHDTEGILGDHKVLIYCTIQLAGIHVSDVMQPQFQSTLWRYQHVLPPGCILKRYDDAADCFWTHCWPLVVTPVVTGFHLVQMPQTSMALSEDLGNQIQFQGEESVWHIDIFLSGYSLNTPRTFVATQLPPHRTPTSLIEFQIKRRTKTPRLRASGVHPWHGRRHANRGFHFVRRGQDFKVCPNFLWGAEECWGFPAICWERLQCPA